MTLSCIKRFRIYSVVLAAYFLLAGCAQMAGERPSSPGMQPSAEIDAIDKVAVLDSVNKQLLSFSGVGRLAVKRKGEILLNERVAWVGAAPNKLSLVVFISGFPTLRFASDGSWFYLIEPHENQSVYKKIRASDSTLSQIIGIRITFDEVISLLRGRIPLADFSTARLSPGLEGAADELALRKWYGLQQKIWLAKSGGRPLSMERFERSGTRRYRVNLDEPKQIQGYQVPQRISILADDDTEFNLAIDRYSPNPKVSSDMFVLRPVQ